NVGKSTLFNRLIGGMVAIVEDTPGVTRDRLYRAGSWRGREFLLVDTGGLVPNPGEDTILEQVKRQASIAMGEADLILMLVDARVGITTDDEEIAGTLRRSEKPVLLVANKVDNFKQPPDIYEFYRLGLGEPIPVSAALGLNIGELLDAMVEKLPEMPAADDEQDEIRIAVIGRPNVGKSSLVNVILGEERVIVSETPGTTRDAIDTHFTRGGQQYVLIDTAGLRRKARINETTERYSVLRALKAIDRCDVALTVIDATQGVTEQDKKIAGYAHEAGKAAVLVINKWDLVPKDEKTMTRFEKEIRSELPFLHYAPIIFVSAVTRQRVNKILELVDFVAEQYSTRIATSSVNEMLATATQLNPPPAEQARRLKILFGTQVKVKPPTFVIFVNDPELVHFSYQRYLENQIRQNFGFEGCPLTIRFKRRSERLHH
ncbi:MAG: ribosome biogenesis GTPase Der, partial [Syntrophomonadaceae bacterium]|nr:ribosome biogenesis GTPase Der [Syntrophomonadaceae bacterium]